MKHDSMRLMRQSKWKESLTCIYFWLLSFYCRWIPSWGLAHNWPLIQSPNSLWRSISQDCLYGKFYYLLDDSCVLLDSRHQIWTPTAHYKTHTHTFLWWIVSSAPFWWFHLWLQGNFWQDPGREEREVGVREEEDNKSQLRLARGTSG